MKERIIFLVLILVMTASCRSEKELPSLSISAEVLNPVNDHLFGHFMEKCSWGGEIGGDLVINPESGEFDPVVLEKLKAMHIPNLRYPGGTDTDYYDWTELIDHAPGQDHRKPYRRYQAGPEGEIVSDNRLGMNEFLELCEELEAEAMLVLNIGDAFHGHQSPDEAAASAANMLAYCNLETGSGNPWPEYRKLNGREKPYAVKYFEIGNEIWGFDGLNWKTKYGSEAVERLFACILAVADTLKALDPGVKTIVDGPLPELNAMLENQAKDLVDYLVFHTYKPWGIGEVRTRGEEGAIDPNTLTAEDLWKAWVATPVIDSSNGMSILPSDRYHSAALGSSFPIAATEWNWNGWLEGEVKKSGLPEPDLAKGIGAAGFLHAMMRRGDRVEMACQSMTVGKGWGITGIRVDPDYVQDAVALPTGQVTGLYSRFHGNELLASEYSGIPTYVQPYIMNSIKASEKVATLDLLATRSDTQLFVHVINRDKNDLQVLKVVPKGLKFKKADYQRHSLVGDREARIDNKHLVETARIESSSMKWKGKSPVLEIPAASVSVFVFDLL